MRPTPGGRSGCASLSGPEWATVEVRLEVHAWLAENARRLLGRALSRWPSGSVWIGAVASADETDFLLPPVPLSTITSTTTVTSTVATFSNGTILLHWPNGVSWRLGHLRPATFAGQFRLIWQCRHAGIPFFSLASSPSPYSPALDVSGYSG